MEKVFYRVGYGIKPDWIKPEMLEGVPKGDYVINSKNGVIIGRDYEMTQSERKRREQRLEKLHG